MPINYIKMTTFDFINDPFTFYTGLIITAATIAGIFYKGLRWLRDEVKKENFRIREEVKEENAEIKKETIERVEQNKVEVRTVAEGITKELTFTKEIIATKLDTIGEVAKENKVSLENYAKDIGKTVTRTHDKVNEHESRLSVIETQLRNIFSSKQPDNNYYAKSNSVSRQQQQQRKDYDDSDNNV